MIANILLIERFPIFIIEIFNKDFEKIARSTTILDETLAQGLVYKILIEDKYEEMGYETGFLYLTNGSSIKEHSYDDDSIEYVVIDGDLEIKSKKYKAGESHKIDSVSKDTIIYICRKQEKIKQKINKIFITEEEKKSIY